MGRKHTHLEEMPSTSADTYASPAAEERLLVQSLADLRAARSKLHRIERGYGGHRERAIETIDVAIGNVESALKARARAPRRLGLCSRANRRVLDRMDVGKKRDCAACQRDHPAGSTVR